jgi:hypothetical protein
LFVSLMVVSFGGVIAPNEKHSACQIAPGVREFAVTSCATIVCGVGSEFARFAAS